MPSTLWVVGDIMETISLSDVAKVDTVNVSKDGRIYVGDELSGETVKLVLIEQEDRD
jgi:uncharacterized protein YjiK